MGQVLSEPVRDKTSESGQDESYIYGTSSMQGWRVTMEDSHACELDLRKTPPFTPASAKESNDQSEDADSNSSESRVDAVDATSGPQVAFFAVYDGHGGTSAALFSGASIHRILVTSDAYKNGKYRVALKDTFLSADRLIKSDPNFVLRPSGCTATVALVSEDTVYVANAGDSRTVLSINGKAKPMSFDHKPTDPGEQARVEQAGGRVKDGRVNEHLALSRAFGDFDFKGNKSSHPESQPVSIHPDITSHKLADDVEFVVLACDGIWDCKTSQEVIDRVRKGIAEMLPLATICENIMNECLSEDFHSSSVGCDNMTITIVGLLRGKTPEQWYSGIADKVTKTEAVTVALDKSEAPAVQVG